MKKIDEEINKIIEDQLPERVGKVLKARLIEADKDKELLAINESAMEELKKKMSEIEDHAVFAGKEIIDLEGKLEKAGNLDEREKEVRKREITQEVEILKHELSCANDSNQKIIGFVDSLMRNTVYRENIFKNKTEEFNNGTGDYDKIETGSTKDKTAE